jgi:branched-chain amino acid transport system substrate-binding protein
MELPAGMGNYWTAGDVIIQAIGKKEGGSTSSRARRSRWSTTTAHSARSRCPLLQERARMHGFQLSCSR